MVIVAAVPLFVVAGMFEMQVWTRVLLMGIGFVIMASGEYETAVDTVGYLAEDAIRLAVIDAIKNTETMGGCISYNDIFSG